jgi:FAD synthase
MPLSETPWTPSEHLVFTKLDEQEGVLLHLKTRRFFSLNETGTRIWELLERGRSLPGIASTLAVEYTVEQEQAQQSVQRFVETLRQEHLLTQGGAGSA